MSPFGAAEPTPQRWFSVSLALRLALLYAVATSILLLALGTGLGFMLRQQLEARDLEELDGKTEIVQHLLGELKSKERIRQQASRVADLSIGHPHLLVGTARRKRVARRAHVPHRQSSCTKVGW